jgi:hypothetical protein
MYSKCNECNETKLIVNNINKLVKYIDKYGNNNEKYTLKANLNIMNNNLENVYNNILISKLYKNMLLYVVCIFLMKSIIL